MDWNNIAIEGVRRVQEGSTRGCVELAHTILRNPARVSIDPGTTTAERIFDGFQTMMKDRDALAAKARKKNDEFKRLAQENVEGETAGASSYGSIAIDDRSALYELVFDHYVAYSVRNEGYTVEDIAEAFSGTVAGIYTSSRFLEYVKLATIAASVQAAPYVHYGFNCLNHIVDVVAFGAPVVSRLRKSQY